MPNIILSVDLDQTLIYALESKFDSCMLANESASSA